jgi:hypothetical protein
VVGLLGFDLSSAFNILDLELLLNKLAAVGITGRSNSWFRSYLVGGAQCVDWDGTVSKNVEVKYGIRQGSILGPVLFTLHTADKAAALGDAPNITYTDDSNVWSIADDCFAIKTNLKVLAKGFVSWACGNGLAVNATKTQFLVLSNGGNYNGITVNVDGKSIAAKNTFNCWG